MGTPISSLPIASTPTGTEYVPIVQSGTTKRTTLLDAAKTLLPITTDEISDGNVTAAKLAPDAVTTAKIADANVTSAKLASGAALANIGTGGITATQLASNAVTTAKIADANVTAAKLDGAQSGSAPIYAARAWVCFDGTGTIGANQTIRGSGNVTSVYKNSTGDYTVTMTTALADTNYVTAGNASGASTTSSINVKEKAAVARTTTAFTILVTANSSTGDNYNDPSYVSIVVFR